MKDFLETLSTATFTRRSRSCWGKSCRACPWLHTCQPLPEEGNMEESQESQESQDNETAQREDLPLHTLFPEPAFFSGQSLAKRGLAAAARCEEEVECPCTPEDEPDCEWSCKPACRPDCPPQCKPDCKPQCPPCGSDCDAERCKVLRSIARTENALAAILEAEGAKLQKAIEAACTVSELLEVNKSVQITLARAAALEQALYLKLEALECLRQ